MVATPTRFLGKVSEESSLKPAIHAGFSLEIKKIDSSIKLELIARSINGQGEPDV
jgi:hypothetical protein